MIQPPIDIHFIECPRDAMQGWKKFIPTEKKIQYINKLLEVGFHTIDFGSFVSPKAIPQMADTRQVISQLSIVNETKLLAIVANKRGAMDAADFERIDYLGFPFSISPTFQMRNTNSTIDASLETVKEIKRICDEVKKQPVIYVSMAFGNPYGDEYSEEIPLQWIEKLVGEGIEIISLADTVGVATPAQVSSLVANVVKKFPGVETGVHLHSTTANWKEKLAAAVENGCMRFDGALKGIGGCPMANDTLVGNMDSELMIRYLKEKGFLRNLNMQALAECAAMTSEIFEK